MHPGDGGWAREIAARAQGLWFYGPRAHCVTGSESTRRKTDRLGGVQSSAWGQRTEVWVRSGLHRVQFRNWNVVAGQGHSRASRGL